MKIDRLLAITMLLINRDRVNAHDLAKQFEVSPRTIYRDIDAINQAGIPVVSYQGKDGGFGVMESYRIDRQVLSAREIYTLITTLKGVCRAVEDRKMDRMLEKIQSLVPSKELPVLRNDKTIFIDVSPWTGRPSEQEKLRLINEAIDRGRLLAFEYLNARGEVTIRKVEPMAIILKEYLRYFYGYCRLRGDYRLFRLSRLSNPRILDEAFTRREMHLDEFSWQSWENEAPPMIRVELRFAEDVRVKVMDSFEQERIRREEDGCLLVTGFFPDGDWLYGMILSYGGSVEVLAPIGLREEIKERAGKILCLYES